MYKKFFLVAVAFCLSIISMQAQNAQVKKAAQAVFSLNTFRADGTLISASHGVFIDSKGEAIAQWKPFVGASKAVVIDSKGKKYDVDGLIGANDIYDVCKFHVSGINADAAPIAKTTAAENTQLWLSNYSVKAPKIVAASVSTVEKFSASGLTQQYPFYILKAQAPDDVAYCPIINDAGEVVALIQSVNNGAVNAVSAQFPADMIIDKIGDATATLAQSLIAPMLPADYNEAQLALLLSAQSRKGESYKVIVEQFIKMFPQKEDGYHARARIYLTEKDFAKAAADMEKAISVAEDKAESHFTYSNLILDKELYMPEEKYDGWNLEKALSEAKAAYAAAELPAYLLQQAKVLFAMNNYDEAYNTYMKLQDTHLAGPETLFAAMQCRQSANAPYEEIIALMDSTIAVCPHPLTFQSAPYVMQRGLICQQYGKYRDAVTSFTQYEKLMVGNRLAPEFYYNRFVCERECRLYQQALNDITKATELAPGNSIYFCELSSFQIRLKMYDEAIASANKAILLDRRNADAYAVLGAAQCLVGKKHEGLLNLEEAKSLGYEAADELIQKYK